MYHISSRSARLRFVLLAGLFIAVGFFSTVVFPTVLFAQEGPGAAEVQERRAELQAELDQLEREIEQQSQILQTKQREKVSLERDVAILNAQIERARLNIRAKNLTIQKLATEIDSKGDEISDLTTTMDRQRQALAQLLRRTNEIDSFTITEVILANQELSEFFVDLNTFEVIKGSLKESLTNLRSTKAYTEKVRQGLSERRAAEIDARVELEAEKRTIERSEAQKRELLSAARSEEQRYQEIVEQRQRRAAEIRSTLFNLRDSAAIPFGEALEYANNASQATGVRPAFILAILKQESNLGENVGTCNLPEDPPKYKWQAIMKPSRDHEPYKRITSELGLDPDLMPLSCPWGNGWGGAMGPSQFIPSTWEAFQSKIAAATGHNPPNPWAPGDAITATAIYLSELGAGRGGYSAEREAALRYYAGGNWNKPQNAFYGDGVLQKAQDIQENMIDPLQNF